MAWFGDGLSSLSNLKGQITSFTKEVLSEGIVEEIDERSKELKESNEKCVQLQELLNSKDAEISLLRRQNCELQKAVVELDEKLRQPNESSQDDDGGGYFWDPPSIKNRDSKKHNQTRSLQEQLSQATVKIRELEAELSKLQKVNAAGFKEEIIADGHQKTELLRAKQDMVNRIIQMGEKNRVAERNMKRLQLDEAALVNDFRMIISQLGSTEQLDLIRGALKALEFENQKVKLTEEEEKSDVGEKMKKLDEAGFESVSLKTANGHIAHKKDDRFNEDVNKRDADLMKKIAELEEENRALTTSIEELDQQHSESIEKILALKEEIQRKHQSLQNAYEQLYVDYNEVQSKLEKAESKLESSEANNNTIVKKTVSIQPSQTDTVRTADVHAQTEAHAENNVPEADADEIDDLTKKVKDILKNDSIEVKSEESIFEAAARQYVEAKWKKDMLERKLTEVSRELKETAEIKESLQMECDDMQTNIESLLLEIQHLKSNLPSIPEASEERVATLETETESLHEEIKRFQTENNAIRQKNADLVLAMHNLEASLRNQENLEAEVRNTKQQLDIAKQQLAGASKNVENNENMMEDLSRRLHVSLDENNELRKKIDQLQTSERQVQEQLRMSLEKCKGLDENIELIEELKLDLETVRKELKTSIVNGKQLESTIKTLQEAKNGMERDLNSVLHEKEELVAELSTLRQTGNTNEDSNLLASLSEQLETANREKDDLEYDILNMRKELDQALSQLDEEQNQVAKLSQENERLVKENSSLLDQLTVTQDESADNIELLNTEMVLFEQKHSILQREADTNKAELMQATEQLHVTEKKCSELEDQLAALRSQTETLQSNNKRLIELEAELVSLRSKEEKLKVVEEKCEKLEKELENMRDTDQKLHSTEDKCSQLESELLSLRSENEMKISADEAHAAKYEKEQILAVLEEKIRENGNLMAENSRLMSTITAEQQKLESTIENNKDATAMARETIDSLSQLVREKDIEIQQLKANSSPPTTTKPEIEVELLSVKSERDELVKLVQTKHNDSLQYYAEVQRLTQIVNEQVSNAQKLVAEREVNSEAMKNKEAELLWAQNELEVVRQRLRNVEASNNYGETCGIVEHSVQVAQAAILNEKCNALEAALLQEQSNNRLLQNQLTESENKESTAAKELERLRTHLMEMEASYTEEALIAERNKEELELKLMQAEERAKNSSTVYTSASIRANQQVETLQQQMALIVQQRDEIQNKLSAAEDKVLAHTASLTNLQIVLEQFQRDKEKDILAATEKIRQELHRSERKQEELLKEVSNLKDQLTEAKECLQAASRLSEQLSKKSERIEQLTQEVAQLTELVNTADERIQEANMSGEGKVDRSLVKNLLLGYLSSSASDKLSVLRVFAIVLDFNESERDKAGLNNPAANSGWFSGLLGSGGAIPSKDQEASLSAAFVRFLESESKPKPQLPALPLSTTPPPRPGHSRQHSSSSTQSTLLLSNITLPTFPDFVPARNTGSILKEVLKDS